MCVCVCVFIYGHLQEWRNSFPIAILLIEITLKPGDGHFPKFHLPKLVICAKSIAAIYRKRRRLYTYFGNAVANISFGCCCFDLGNGLKRGDPYDDKRQM